MNDSIENMVAELRGEIEAIDMTRHITTNGQMNEVSLASFMVDPLNRLAERFIEIVGAGPLKAFYLKTNEENDIKLAVFNFLLNAVRQNSMPVKPSRLVVGWPQVLEVVQKFADTIKTGVLTWTYRILLSGLDITEDIQLANGVRLVKHTFEPGYLDFAAYWHRDSVAQFIRSHRTGVEAVIEGSGKLSELRATIEEHYELLTLENNIANWFLIAGVPEGLQPPKPSQFSVESVFGRIPLARPQEAFSLYSPRPLSKDDVSKLQRASELATRHTIAGKDQDSVLEGVIDRYVLGLNQSLKHPNRGNSPNWDKLVDYAIALESLFTAGVNSTTEVAYRFRLNGSVLLAPALKIPVKSAFDRLNAFYGVRCAIVHGGNQGKINESLKKLIGKLDPKDMCERLSKAEDHVKFRVVCEAVATWIRKLLHYVDSIPKAKRPYIEVNNQARWEEYLWGFQASHSDLFTPGSEQQSQADKQTPGGK